MRLLKQSSTAQKLTFLMVDSSDHITPKTGLSPTVTLSKSGGSFASPAGAVSEIANGWYVVAGNATDTNTLGSLILHATATGADPTDREYEIVAFDPQTASLGLVLAAGTNVTGLNDPTSTTIASAVRTELTTELGRVDAAVSSRMASYTQPTGFLAATFPTTVASPTNITGGTITTVTNLTNAPSDSSGTTTLLSRLTSTRAGNLDFLDAAISTRSTYDGGDTSGVTTLLARLTATRSGYLDNLTNLDAEISTRMAAGASVTLAATQSLYAPAKAGDAMTLTGAYDAAKTAASQSSVNSIPTNPITSLSGIATATNVSATQAAIIAALPAAPDNTSIAAAKAVTDKLNSTLELNGSVYRLTAPALALAPSGGGGSGSAPTASEVADAVWDEALLDHIIPGSFGSAMRLVRAGTAGKWTIASDQLKIFDVDGVTLLTTLNLSPAGGHYRMRTPV